MTQASAPSACASRAENAVERFTAGQSGPSGFETFNCSPTANESAVNCVVSGSRGRGDAMDIYLVVFSRSCKNVFRVELIGEK